MTDANNTAKQLASLGGVTLGKPNYISQTSYYQPIMKDLSGAVTAGSSAPTPINPGTTDITMTVQVTYSIIK